MNSSNTNEKKKIVVVEDDEDMRWMLVELLKNQGYEVTGISNGVEIIEGHCQLPDLYVLDKEMDFIDGEIIAQFLRLSPEAKTIPIIMLSGTNSRKSAKAAGVDYYFEKPFQTKEFISTIRVLLNYPVSAA